MIDILKSSVTKYLLLPLKNTPTHPNEDDAKSHPSFPPKRGKQKKKRKEASLHMIIIAMNKWS